MDDKRLEELNWLAEHVSKHLEDGLRPGPMDVRGLLNGVKELLAEVRRLRIALDGK